MTQTEKVKIQQQINIYGYDLTPQNVYDQIKKSIRKASYRNSDVFIEINAGSTQRFGIRVKAINTRNFKIA